MDGQPPSKRFEYAIGISLLALMYLAAPEAVQVATVIFGEDGSRAKVATAMALVLVPVGIIAAGLNRAWPGR